MGLAMATNIQKHLTQHDSPPLKYWNRTLSRGDSLKDIGSTPCSSIADLIQNCDVIFISVSLYNIQHKPISLTNHKVSDDTALQSITNTILSSGPLTSKTIIDTTTVHPTTTSTITNHFNSSGASYIAAPVFGATPLAQAGRLLIAVAGPASAIDPILPFLQDVIARAVIRVGDEPSQALLLKTTSNFITAGLMLLLSEAHVLAEKSGLSASVLESLIGENFGAYAHGMSKRLTSGSYFPVEGQTPSSGLELGIKDVGHGVSLARGKGMELRIGEMYLGAAEEAKAYGDEKGRRCDSSAVFGAVRRRAGLEFEADGVKERDAEIEEERKK
jgi:3-hydroxyisobutyrate dehydrogenase-like beta-hydroxyacid dehydrogenase